MMPAPREQFSKHEIDRVRAINRISEVVGRFVEWDTRKSNPRRGDFWACCPFHGEKSASFHCEDQKGAYHCFGCGASGDVFAFLIGITGCTFRQAVAQLGGSADDIIEDEQARLARQRLAEANRQKFAAEERERSERRLERADGLWNASGPVTGSPAELYLLGRGLHLPAWPEVLRCHRSLPHPDGGRFPALVCRVDDVDGNLTGVWRIFVTEDGRKAPVSEVKLGLGPTAGGAVRLFSPINGEIGIAEGVETALAVHLITGGKVAMWAGLSTSGVRGFVPPFDVERIRCFPDNDIPKRAKDGRWASSPGLSAAEGLKERMDAEGIGCVVEPGPRGGRDYLDVLNAMQRGR